MKEWLMITNPGSASSTNGQRWKECEKQLLDGGLSLETRLTERQGHAIRLAQEAAAEGYRKFIAGGGDDTIHEVMTGLLRYCDANSVSMGNFTLAVLPLGTGNDWIRSANIPSDVAEAAECIIRGKTAKEDVVRMTLEGGVFCMANIGGIGVDADICARTNRLKEKGRKGGFLYTMVAPAATLSRKRNPVEVVCDGEVVYKGPLFTATLGNGTYRGGGLIQTHPDTRWNDGRLDVSIMPGVNHIKGLMLMMHCMSGDLALQPKMITRSFKKMTVTPLSNGKDWVEIDGELPGCLPLTMEITGEQINIIVA